MPINIIMQKVDNVESPCVQKKNKIIEKKGKSEDKKKKSGKKEYIEISLDF